MNCFWTGVLFSLVVTDVAALQCYSCKGNSDCRDTETCKEHQQMCRTTVMTIISRPKISTYFLKGCDVSGKPNNSISHLLGHRLVFLAEEHCETDLCNSGIPKEVPRVRDMIRIRGHNENLLNCYSCTAADNTCNNPSFTQMRCFWPQDRCIDIASLTDTGELPKDQERIKGCGQLSHCQDALGFQNHKSFHMVKCCNSSLCNNDVQDYKRAPLPLNGVTCHSCEGNATHGCAPDNITTVQCRGPMAKCLEASGIHGISGNYSIVKGCASPSWCNSPYTSIYKNLGSVETHCCTGDLCNSLIIDGKLKPSPRSQANHLTLAHHAIMSTGLLLFIVFLLS
ncbi:urokinase plasminogen activator surface receptor-like [Pantherophis guttatus]|uniref:Urokinase plasminogen activator surface receptor n=1 Tax=Pantherophis guttatus TaxID=94885 RepID=A0A6P9DT75_PANGU|nr:urokinase plasminogen activator surface receptor-like [Pantherophis guttatus]